MSDRPRRLDVALTPELVVAPERGGGGRSLAIVVDVLRATSAMVTALSAGAGAVRTFGSVDAARADATARRPRPLLGGERRCRRIDGFDRGNSPGEYERGVEGREINVTTTNGTRAVEAAGPFDELWLAAWLNVTAVVDAAGGAGVSTPPDDAADVDGADVDGTTGDVPDSRFDVTVVASGTDGAVTAEDVHLAGEIVRRLHRSDDHITDAARLAVAWSDRCGSTRTGLTPAALTQALADTAGGRNLIAAGFADDLERVADIDRYDVVPRRVSRRPATFRPSVADDHPA